MGTHVGGRSSIFYGEATAVTSEQKPSGHWPFDANASDKTAAEANREALERKRARDLARVTAREHIRHDRLIVGGRAHTRKHGLS
jgi:type IV secretory pathway VirB9-like protein